MNGLNGKVAIVTGGGSGLGEAIAKALAREAVKVVLSDTNLQGVTGVFSLVGRCVVHHGRVLPRGWWLHGRLTPAREIAAARKGSNE